MEQELLTRFRVVGEMAEKYFPHGFVGEVLDLIRPLSAEDQIGVLDTYDFFLEAQRKYQQLAHEVHADLMAELAGAPPQNLRKLDYLVAGAQAVYPEGQLEALRRTVRNIELKPSQHYDQHDLDQLMDRVTDLVFVMNDSPTYPTERAAKFYQFVYSAGRLKTLAPRTVLQHLLPHAAGLVKAQDKTLKA